LYPTSVYRLLIFSHFRIIPQAVCARFGLAIGAFFAWPVRILMFIEWIVAYPIACLLDWTLGHQNGVIYRHAQLKELVALHSEDQSGPLTKDEVSVLRAVLDLRDKSVSDIMTRLEDVFMLPLSSTLGRETISSVCY
jgi:metal transporter CNNM